MNHFGKIAVLGAALAAAAPFVQATPITGQLSFAGTDSYSANTITFASGTSMIGGMVTGTLGPYFTDGTAVTMTNFSIDGTFVPTNVFSVTQNGETLTYFLQTLSTTFSIGGTVGPYPGDLMLMGSGYFTETGAVNYTQTAANFNLTSQFGSSGGSGVTFSETNFAMPPTPEPSSIALLGTGLLGVAFLVRRRLTT